MKASEQRRIPLFIREVHSYYAKYRRDMAWREYITPYRVVVSEIMLQQTQVDRVAKKFDSWMKRFPDWKSLAQASTKDILQEWSGLGYNRRALYLKRIAETITGGGKAAGAFPKTFEGLRTLPGIGPNTAGSILAFAYNIPHPFIETNIRSAFIHFFFPMIEKKEGKRACKKIRDDEIMPLIEMTLTDKKNATNPREWYYALMDYGSHIKKQLGNPSRRSAHHVKQKPFKGSNREVRSNILKIIMRQDSTQEAIQKQLRNVPAEKIGKNVEDLVREGFIIKMREEYRIAS